jgi:hypothetical protein
MMAELLTDIKLQTIQGSVFGGLETDSYADFSFILGDMNYRINSTFAHLTKHIEECHNKNNEQLYISMKNGSYPGYIEGKKLWKPTYKLSFTDQSYLEKKDQAPSYTDRILHRNNTCIEAKIDCYDSLAHVLGSDHRPVKMDLSFKALNRMSYTDVSNSEK